LETVIKIKLVYIFITFYKFYATADTINVTLVDTGTYTYDAGHDYYADITTAARVGSAKLIATATRTLTGGVFDAADVVFTAVTGATVEAVVIWKDTGDEATSPVIAYIEGSVTPNGGDVTIQWDSGASKIFAL